jgi:hypothetical protein
LANKQDNASPLCTCLCFCYSNQFTRPSRWETLRKVLRGLAFGEEVLQPEGNYVVVTPLASGKAVVDWINQGDHKELVETVGLWIPIASPAIASVDKGKLASLCNQGWPILALYEGS